MKEHTSGPWKFDHKRDQVIAANESLICKIATGEDRIEEEANAQLIASAPELLEACKRAEQHLSWLLEHPLDCKASSDLTDKIAIACLHAITKSEGNA